MARSRGSSGDVDAPRPVQVATDQDGEVRDLLIRLTAEEGGSTVTEDSMVPGWS